MPEFLPTLIAGVILFIILLIAFGGYFDFYTVQPSLEKRIRLEENFILLFNASNRSLTSLDGNVSQGAFSSESDTISFSAINSKDISEGTVRLNVINTNLYGRLILTINGVEVYRDYFARGNHTFSFSKNPFKDSENVLKVSAEGSGWRIWAPTIYIYSMNLYGQYFGAIEKNFTFNISEDEYSRMNASRLVISSRKIRGGNLIANINGQEVFRDSVNAFVDLNTTLLKPGLNYLWLRTERDSRYEIPLAEVVLFFRK